MKSSQPFDPFIDTKAELHQLYKVLDEVLDCISVGRTRLPNRNIYLFAHTKIYLNLFVVWKHHPQKTVGISRRKSYWDSSSIYRHPQLSYTVMINLLDAMRKKKWLNRPTKGYFDSTLGIGETTRYRASDKLIKAFKADKLTLAHITKDEFFRDTQGIVLRGKKPKKTPKNKSPKGKPIEFKFTNALKNKQQNIAELNWAFDKAHIDLFVTKTEEKKIREHMTRRASKDKDKVAEIQYNNKYIQRIYNEDFQHGGRFYGGFWQQIPKEWRSRITINNKLTVEVDYSSLHLSMLYWRQKNYFNEDPYALSEGDRTSNKLALNFMLNATNFNECLSAVKKEKKILHPSKHIKGCKDYESYLKFLAAVHKPIKKYFFTGIGLKLQRQDSDMAEAVMMRMFQQGRIALPMHDSFITAGENIYRLNKVMQSVSKELLGSMLKMDIKQPKINWDIDKINKNTSYYDRRRYFIKLNKLRLDGDKSVEYV